MPRRPTSPNRGLGIKILNNRNFGSVIADCGPPIVGRKPTSRVPQSAIVNRKSAIMLGLRMRLVIDVDQLLDGDLGVLLRGGEAGVAEHLLDSSQVSAFGQQVRGKSMPQGMGAYVNFGSEGTYVTLYQPIHRPGSEPPPA